MTCASGPQVSVRNGFGFNVLQCAAMGSNDAEVAANLAWGGPDGRTAYFTASTSVYRLTLKVPGNLPLYFRK